MRVFDSNRCHTPCMGRFENAGRCPDCQSDVRGRQRCGVCGLSLVGPDADRLRGLLAEADVVLDRLRSGPVTAPLPTVASPGRAPTQPWPTGAAPTPLLPPMLPPPPRKTLPAFSTPVILLLLGALSVFTAAVVFVTVSWSDLSLAAKAAILLGVTAILGGIGRWAMGARLRGTTETFSGLFTVMVTLDFLAARSGGLAGLDGLSETAASWTAALLLVVGSVLFAVPGVRVFGKLTTVQLLAAVGALGLVGLAVDDLPGRTEFVVLVVAVLLLPAVVVAVRAALWLLAAYLIGYAAVLLVVSLVVSVLRVAEDATLRAMWGTGDAVGLVVWAAIFVAVAMSRRVPGDSRILAASAAVLALLTVGLRPLEGSDIDVVVGVLGAVALVAALSLVVFRKVGTPWREGLTAGSVTSGLLGLVFILPTIVVDLSRIGDAVEHAWALEPSDHLIRNTVDRLGTDLTLDLVSPLVLGGVLLALFVAAVGLARRSLPPPVPSIAAVVAAAALVLLGYDLALVWYVTVLGVLATGAALVALARRDLGCGLAALFVGAAAAALSLGAPETTLGAALVVTVLLSVVSTRTTSVEAVTTSAAFAVMSAAVAVGAGGELASLTPGTIGDLVAGVGALAVLVAQLRPGDRDLLQRLGLEAGSVPVALAGIALAVEDPTWRLPIALTAYGAALSLVALLRSDRRIVGYAGGFLLAVATWVRLAVEDVSVVEAYTLPSAAALLVVGTVRMYRTTAPSLTVLSPGLSLALLPSLLVALDEPTSLRALVLGLCALALVLVGAAERWAAPMLFGGVTAAMLLVVNIAPYAQAVPRWVLFAVIGAGLLYLGITWEHRLRNLRSLALALERIR